MLQIRKATPSDTKQILRITQDAFKLYRDALHTDTPVRALKETEQDVLNDIHNHSVFVAEEGGIILGAIRYCLLSGSLAYIYRFAVDPAVSHTGIGSDLLAHVITECENSGVTAIALHTNAKYYGLARYYYGKEFFVHSTETGKGYIRALFVKELKKNIPYDISPAFEK